MKNFHSFVAAAAASSSLISASAFSAEYGWRQDDWSGGPGQANFTDATRYRSSTFADSRGVPGKVRLSFISSPYTKDPSNPVIPKGGAGAWDQTYVRGGLFVEDADGYKVLYNGTDGGDVNAAGYAESADGVHWTKDAGNPALRRSGTKSWDDNGVTAESLVRDGDTWHCFFLGEDTSGNNACGHATSTDLKNWSRGADPVLSPGAPGSWDGQSISEVRALKVGSVFHLWYAAYSLGGSTQVGHATSADGGTWVKDPANPRLGPGSAGHFDDMGILHFEVLRRPWSGDYLLAYTGSHVGGFGIGIATSPDGSLWVKDAANPKFSTGGANWFADNLEPNGLSFDGSMYRVRIKGSAPGATSSGEAWSQDGSVWNPNFLGVLLSPSPAPSWDSRATAIGAMFLEGNGLRAFYVGNPLMPCYTIGTATADAFYSPSGTLTSSVFDAGAAVDWKAVKWGESKPAGTDVKVEVRCGDTAVPDGSWTGWAQVANGGQNPHADSRSMQYRVALSTTDSAVSPELWGLSFNLPIDLTPNKWAFSTTDAIAVSADVEPMGIPCFPFIRVTLPAGGVLYYERNRGFRTAPTPYLGFRAGAIVVPSAIAGYPALGAAFSNLTRGTYVLEGGAVDAAHTTAASNLVYINPLDREVLVVE